MTVLGLGRFGGGLGVTRWLAGQGVEVLVTDAAPAARLSASVDALDDLVANGRVRLRLGEHRSEDFTNCDAVVASPAVPAPWRDEWLGLARDAGIPITTEIRLLTERLDRRRVIGVTGSAGKSTTVSMIGHLLNALGRRAHVGGNIGGSLLGALDVIEPDDWIVLELSSFMLHWLGAGVGMADAPGFSPHVAVLTNLAENHLDWHGSFDHYVASKENIFRYQDAGDHQCRGDDGLNVEFPTGDPQFPLELAVPGAHNQCNARLAITAVRAVVEADPVDAARHLASFRGLPHRLERVATASRAQRFYNDSKSTTPAATVLAVKSFDDPSQVHLIAGGYDKGSDLSPIAALAPRLAGLYTIGQTGPALAAAATTRVHECATLERAVARARERMGDDDVLLLSPGCASWDQFEHFQRRGDAFKAMVTRSLVP